MKKNGYLLLLIVGFIFWSGETVQAGNVNRETTIYFENTYIPEPDVDKTIATEVLTEPDLSDSSHKLPQTGEKQISGKYMTMGILLSLILVLYFAKNIRKDFL